MAECRCPVLIGHSWTIRSQAHDTAFRASQLLAQLPAARRDFHAALGEVESALDRRQLASPAQIPPLIRPSKGS